MRGAWISKELQKIPCSKQRDWTVNSAGTRANDSVLPNNFR